MKKLIVMLVLAVLCTTSAMAQNVVEDDAIFVVAENAPEFPGGEDSLYAYIARNIVYLEAAKKEKIEGRVFVTFVIVKNGRCLSQTGELSHNNLQ